MPFAANHECDFHNHVNPIAMTQKLQIVQSQIMKLMNRPNTKRGGWKGLYEEDRETKTANSVMQMDQHRQRVCIPPILNYDL